MISRHEDKRGRELAVGDRIIWDDGQYHGSVLELLSSCSGNAQVKIHWDHRRDNDFTLHFPRTVINITEADIKIFFEQTALDDHCALGKRFCDKFKFNDLRLRDMVCPGMARKRIIEQYAMKI